MLIPPLPRETIEFHLSVATAGGTIQIPQIAASFMLSGRQSKAVVTDYSFGTSTLLYSTASVLFAGKIGARDVLFLYGDARHEHEFSTNLRGTPSHHSFTRKSVITLHSLPTLGTVKRQSVVNIMKGVEGLITIWDSKEQLVLFSDTKTAGTFWAPEIPGTSSDLSNFWGFGTNSSILMGGPYLVRSANITEDRLDLRGDLEQDVRLFLFAPSTVRYVSWNGIPVAPDLSISEHGGFSILLAQRAALLASPIKIPRLDSWKYANSLPEIEQDYSDARWTHANRTSTNIPYPPHYGDGTVLYGCDYGLYEHSDCFTQFSTHVVLSCENIVIWRGHFEGTKEQHSVNISINGGEGKSNTSEDIL